MPEQPPKDLLLGDPLAEVTRKERRLLLGVSIIAVAIVKTGLLPSKIESLGVQFDKTNQQALLSILAWVTLYFLVAFVIYAAADFLAWRRALRRQDTEDTRAILAHKSQGHDEELYESVRNDRLALWVFRPVAVLRAGFEFLLPILVGGYAMRLLWLAAAHI
jgi:hypothetical protein